jgi:hypothetical protein
MATSKVSKISESTSPAKIPHRNVDNLDEEVLHKDVQCNVDGFRQTAATTTTKTDKKVHQKSNAPS